MNMEERRWELPFSREEFFDELNRIMSEIREVCSSSTEDPLPQNELPADSKRYCFESGSCDITSCNSLQHSGIQDQTIDENNSQIIDQNERESSLLCHPKNQLKEEIVDISSKVNEHIDIEDLNNSMFANASSSIRDDLKNPIGICLSATEDSVAHRSRLFCLSDQTQDSLESKSCAESNFSGSENSGIQNQETTVNNDSLPINKSADQTGCKIDQGPKSLLPLKERFRELIEKSQEIKGIVKEIENQESESLERMNEKKNFSVHRICIPCLVTERNYRSSEGEILSNQRQRPEEKESERQERIQKSTEFNKNRIEILQILRDWSTSKEAARSTCVFFQCVAIFWIFCAIVLMKLVQLKHEHLIGIINGNPNMQMDQLMSILLVDEFDDNIWANEGRLYSIASMYGMRDLKNRTSSRLQSGITVSNAWITLVLADVYKDQRLKESSELFLTTYSNETLHSEIWKEEMQSMMTAATQKYKADFESHYLNKE